MTKEQEYQWFCEYLGTTPPAYVSEKLKIVKNILPHPPPPYPDQAPTPNSQNKKTVQVTWPQHVKAFEWLESNINPLEHDTADLSAMVEQVTAQ